MCIHEIKILFTVEQNIFDLPVALWAITQSQRKRADKYSTLSRKPRATVATSRTPRGVGENTKF
jgi:hypothetical protein